MSSYTRVAEEKEYKNLEKLYIYASDVTRLNIELPREIVVEGDIFWTLDDIIQEGGNIRLNVNILELRKIDVLIYNSNERSFITELYGKFETHTIKKGQQYHK